MWISDDGKAADIGDRSRRHVDCAAEASDLISRAVDVVLPISADRAPPRHLGSRPAPHEIDERILEPWRHGHDADAVVAQLIEHRPPDLQIIVVTRLHLRARTWTRQRAYGELRTIGRGALAFDPDEVTDYFRREFAIVLTPQQARRLIDETEGWPIALSLLGQHLRDHDLSIDALIAEKTDLARDVVEGGERLLTEMANEELLQFVALDVHKALGE